MKKAQHLLEFKKKKLYQHKITWISKIEKLKKYPSIFVANEFFDSFPIKQFKKKENIWFEKYVQFKSKNSIFFF